MNFTQTYLAETTDILTRIDCLMVENIVRLLTNVRTRNGRLFLLGVGGSAANCTHAVNDFRKLAGIETYAPTDNVAELTARINDEGWENVFVGWLQASRLTKNDLVFILSVGGGNQENNISPNLVTAVDYARQLGTPIAGIVGRDGGYTAKLADACLIIPTVNPAAVTPHTEALQSVIIHLLVSHPELKMAATKWESVAKAPQPCPNKQ